MCELCWFLQAVGHERLFLLIAVHDVFTMWKRTVGQGRVQNGRKSITRVGQAAVKLQYVYRYSSVKRHCSSDRCLPSTVLPRVIRLVTFLDGTESDVPGCALVRPGSSRGTTMQDE